MLLPLAALVLSAPVRFTIPAQTAAPRFADAVLRNFEAWDADRDGALQPVEVERAALDARFRGSDAAALAALHVWLAAVPATAPVPRLDRAWFQAYRPVRLVIPKGTPPAEAKRLRRAYAATPESLGTSFASGVKRLAGSEAAPLYRSDGPVLADIRQGALGDCFVLAPLGAILHRDPGAVRGMILPTLDGARTGYLVRFGDGKETRVGALTDAELAMGGAATEGGLWTRVMEKAFGRRNLPDDAQEVSRDGMSGGKTRVAASALTGREFASIGLVGDFRKEVAESELNGRRERVRREIVAAIGARRLVLASSPDREMPRSLNGKHAYAVFAYEPAADRVTVWNPHGNDFTPRGPEGPENGYTRREGVFSMPLTMFVRSFSRLYIEKP